VKFLIFKSFFLLIFIFINYLNASAMGQIYLNHNFLQEKNNSILLENSSFLNFNPINFRYFREADKELWSQTKPNPKENFMLGLIEKKIISNFWQNWQFGYFEREELHFTTNPEFITIYSLFRQDFLEMPEKKVFYQPYGNAEFYRAKGFFIEKTFNLNNHYFNFRYRKLRGDDFFLMNVNGATYEDDTYGLVYLIDIDHYFAERSFLSNKAIPNKERKIIGIGEAFDISYYYFNKNFILELGVQNLFGHIKWSHLGNYFLIVDSQTTYIGEDGYRHTKPISSGKYNFDTTYTQDLFLHYYFYSSYSFAIEKQYKLSFLAVKFGEIARHQIGISFEEKNRYYLNYIINENIYELGFASELIEFSFSLSLFDFYYNKFISASLKFKF
jgi:hypothetical protein